MELRLFSNANVSANLDRELREKMEDKVLAEFPNYTTKASAIEYLLKEAVKPVAEGDEHTAELNAKIEAYKVQEEYLKAELEKAQNKPPQVKEVEKLVEVPQNIFDADFYKYLKQVAFLVSPDFCPKNDINALVRRVFAHYQQQGNFVFDAKDIQVLKENGLME